MPSALTFGRLNAPNRALLVHGLSASSLTWHRVGPALATAGYYVTCPDLLNHGFGGERSGDCSVAAFGEALFREYYQEGDCYFDLIVAHSLGGPIVAYLLDKLFSEGMGLPDRVVLVDPAMEMQVTRPLVESYMDQVGVPAHVWQEQNPTWTWMDCLVKEMGNKQISVEDVRRIFQLNAQWNFWEFLHDPLVNTSVRFICLAAEDDPVYQGAPLADYLEVYTVPNTGHSIQREDPDAIVQAALRDEMPGYFQQHD